MLQHVLAERLLTLEVSCTYVIILQLQKALMGFNLLLVNHHTISVENVIIRGWWDTCCKHCRPQACEVGMDKTFAQLLIQQHLLWLVQIIIQIQRTVKVYRNWP